MTLQTSTEEHDRAYKLENYRTCELCSEPVDGGVEGIVEHIEDEHDLEALAHEVSHNWTPHEPSAVHLPNGTVHFGGSRHGPEMVDTTCGLTIEVNDLDGIENLRNLISYDHADAEAYCGNCVQLTKRRFGRDYLPKPLQEREQ
ncbi:hypothetical protein [Haloarcula sp. Atlit-120R]|uniref:hypothetical protein n=1 Tax=Haloarcula sp. Atlit-120R TaxID=2282135 RepID=UPI000EF22AA6|nr:hypothetical protein [Haloarcula sp. Atlit-120R]RLM32657.1 hypothetical protein DVK01_20510 [Haloarcula sp. Atlit-120R]